jgi:exonuclease SbcC
MLESLKIKNVQIHKLFEVEFDEHITTFTGPSESGKSAIIRALLWWLFNEGNVKDLRRTGVRDFSVSGVVDNRRIGRLRGRSNSYKFEGKSLRSFGSGVPEVVAQVFDVGPTNVQRQHDRHFWFSESRAFVSRELNKIVDLEIIDSSLKNIGIEVRDAKAAVRVIRDQKKEARSLKKALEWVSDVRDRVDILSRMLEDVAEISEKADRLRELLDGIHTLQIAQRTERKRLAKQKRVQSLGANLEAAASKERDLSDLIREIELSTEHLTSQKKQLKIETKKLRKFKQCPICKSPMT